MTTRSTHADPQRLAGIAQAVAATAEVLGQEITATAAEMIADDLAEYPDQMIADALKTCRRELTGKLTLAAILDRAHAADGRPGRDEAWSIALDGSDEFNTVVLTDEIRQAMSAATPILEAGDKVGARMAFLSAYDRLVADARREKRPVSWSVSLGYDPDLRTRAIENAVRLQQLPRHVADQELARLSHQPVADDGLAIAGLLTGKVAAPSEKNRERFQQLKQHIEETTKARKEREAAALAERIAVFEQRRSEFLQQVGQLEASRA